MRHGGRQSPERVTNNNYTYFVTRWIKKEYKNPIVIISENGWADDGRLEDVERVDYIRSHLEEVVRAVRNSECNVQGYTIWSIIDNFEWLSGYT